MSTMIADERQGRLYSLTEAGEILGMSHWTLRRHVDEGTIPATKLGRLVKLSTETIEKIRAEGLPSLK